MKIAEILQNLYEAVEIGGYKLQIEFGIGKAEEKEIDYLDLSTRATNALKRAKIFTIKDIVNSAQNVNDLMQIKNMGKGSAVEVMSKLLNYQIEKNISLGRKPLEGISLV